LVETLLWANIGANAIMDSGEFADGPRNKQKYQQWIGTTRNRNVVAIPQEL
jgi:hypothetical protein